ncbi:MAG: dTDP-4-dehydrorhamnose reductase [Halomonas sp.]|nr:dTDP-4-dehydrorhamnose reductase [Halomonas sp.]
MQVLITGAQGQVGHELMRSIPEGFEVVGLGSNELDIADRNAVNEAFLRLDPDMVINAAAYTAVDKAEKEPEVAYAVNRDGVGYLGEVASQAGVPVLHISTDYVFSGKNSTPYTENDATSPTGVYGASKLAGEQVLMENCPHHVILRTSWVFGTYGNNFVKTMLRLARERNELSIVADQLGGPTSAMSIAHALWRLASKYKKDDNLHWGVYHFSGLPSCSWYDFAEEIFLQAFELGMLENKPVIKPITTAEFPTPAKRPEGSVLDCSKIEGIYGITPSDWRADLNDILKHVHNNGF